MNKEIKTRQAIEKYIISALQYEENYRCIEERGITEVYFSPGTLRELFRLCMEYYKTYGKPLTPEILFMKVSHLVFNPQAVANLYASFKFVRKIKTNPNDLPYYCDCLKDYLAGDILSSSFQEAIEIRKKGGSHSNIKALEKLQEELIKKQSLIETDSVVKVYDVEDMEILIKEEMIDRKLHPEKYSGLKSGILSIDEAFASPLNIGELTLFMAPPGGGKTTVMLSVADAIWRNSSANVVFASLEMSAVKLGFKHLSANSVTSYDRLENVNLTETNKKNIIAAFEERKSLSQKAKFKYLEISSAGLIKSNVLESAIKNILPYQKIDLLVVDYLELLACPEAAKDDYWIRMGYVCKFLRGLGKKYGFTVISAVQLKREAINRIRKTKDTKLDFGADDAQGSNQISADADRIYALWIDPKDERRIKMYTAKNRYGRRNYECNLFFDPACSRIYEDITKYDHEKYEDIDKYTAIINQVVEVAKDETNETSETGDRKDEQMTVIQPDEICDITLEELGQRP